MNKRIGLCIDLRFLIPYVSYRMSFFKESGERYTVTMEFPN